MAFYGLAAALWLVSAVFIGSTFYAKGSASRNPEIASYQAAIATSENLVRAAEAKAAKARATVIVEYKDRVKVIHASAPAEIKLVEVVRAETPADCFLPGAYRELWDGPNQPASGDPAPKDSPRVDAAPVPLADAAETARIAKQRFQENAARLSALQSYLSKIDEAAPVTQ